MDSVLNNNDIYNSVKCNLVNIVVCQMQDKHKWVKNKKEQTKLFCKWNQKKWKIKDALQVGHSLHVDAWSL